MRIREMAGRLGISTDSIRYWEKRGLLRPSRAANGYRDYGEEEHRRLILIGYAKEAGFTLSEIAGLLDSLLAEGFTFEDLSSALSAQRQRIERKIAELAATRDRISRILDGCPRKARLSEALFGKRATANRA